MVADVNNEAAAMFREANAYNLGASLGLNGSLVGVSPDVVLNTNGPNGGRANLTVADVGTEIPQLGA